MNWGAVLLETPGGPVYVATDDYEAARLGAAGHVVLARSEIDAVLSLTCWTAPPDYLRRTLWIELRALLALKRALPGCGVAMLVSHATGETVDLTPAPVPIPELPTPPRTHRRAAAAGQGALL